MSSKILTKPVLKEVLTVSVVIARLWCTKLDENLMIVSSNVSYMATVAVPASPGCCTEIISVTYGIGVCFVAVDSKTVGDNRKFGWS